MQEANVNGKRVPASPDTRAAGTCPDCSAEVQRRHITRMDIYCHTRGQGRDCPRRYRPTWGAGP